MEVCPAVFLPIRHILQPLRISACLMVRASLPLRRTLTGAVASWEFGQAEIPIEVIPLLKSRWLLRGRLTGVASRDVECFDSGRSVNVATSCAWTGCLVIVDLVGVDLAPDQLKPGVVAVFKDRLDERGVLVVIFNNFDQAVSTGDLVVLEIDLRQGCV